ncbi:MAG: HK97 gp10 family phage protein [Clostridia bacterium]|nr:HK97 gp10 family phage protein [Clostridia bacterium]
MASLEDFRKNLEKVKAAVPQTEEKILKKTAEQYLGLVINRTPIGEYPNGSGRVGGVLARGWTSKTEEEARSGTGDGKEKIPRYVAETPVEHRGNQATMKLVNPVHYGPYVDFGHRIMRKGRCVGMYNGLHITEKAAKSLDMQKIADDYSEQMFKDVFGK